MKWLLDTNVVSEGVRNRPNDKVLSWIAAQPDTDSAISVVTLAELRDGALSARDEAKRNRLINWIETKVLDSFDSRTLPLTVEILVDWVGLARILRSKGHTRDAADLLIAATARTHNLILVTRNVRHFAGTGVVVYDPWNGETHRMEPV